MLTLFITQIFTTTWDSILGLLCYFFTVMYVQDYLFDHEFINILFTHVHLCSYRWQYEALQNQYLTGSITGYVLVFLYVLTVNFSKACANKVVYLETCFCSSSQQSPYWWKNCCNLKGLLKSLALLRSKLALENHSL